MTLNELLKKIKDGTASATELNAARRLVKEANKVR